MRAIATTTATVYRGESTDPVYGDPIDTKAIHLTGVRMSLMEQSQVVLKQDTNTPMIVRYAIGRVDNGVDIVQNDRILDNQTGFIYEVDDWSIPGYVGTLPDRKLSLRRVD